MVLHHYLSEHNYEFLIDPLNKVATSGFIANWPPFNCDLNLISSDTLELRYYQLGVPETIEIFVRVN
jgi:hypothetical protein